MAHGFNCVRPFLDGGEGALSVGHEGKARVGEGHASARPFEEALTDLALQGLNAGGNGWLSQKQRLGRAAKRTVMRDLEECFELGEFQLSSPWERFPEQFSPEWRLRSRRGWGSDFCAARSDGGTTVVGMVFGRAAVDDAGGSRRLGRRCCASLATGGAFLVAVGTASTGNVAPVRCDSRPDFAPAVAADG